MAFPTFKFATDPNAGTSAVYGAPDLAYALHVVDGSHATDRIPIAAIEGTAVALSGTQTISGNKLYNNTTLQVNNPAATFQYIINSSAIVANRNATLPLLIADDIFVFAAFSQTLTNKTMSGSQNTFSSIPSSALVTLLTSHTLDDSNTLVDTADNTKKLAWDISGATTGKKTTFTFANTLDRIVTFPDSALTVAGKDLAQTWTALQTINTLKLYATDIVGSNTLKVCSFADVASALNWIDFTAAATGNPSLINAAGETNSSIKFVPKGTGEVYGIMETMVFPLGDETTVPAATTNTFVAKTTWYAPRAGKIVWAEQCATIAPNTTVTLDIQKGGVTIFSTRPTLVSSTTGSNAVLTSAPTSVSKGDKLEFGIYNTAGGNLLAGTKLTIGFYRTA